MLLGPDLPFTSMFLSHPLLLFPCPVLEGVGAHFRDEDTSPCVPGLDRPGVVGSAFVVAKGFDGGMDVRGVWCWGRVGLCEEPSSRLNSYAIARVGSERKAPGLLDGAYSWCEGGLQRMICFILFGFLVRFSLPRRGIATLAGCAWDALKTLGLNGGLRPVAQLV